MLRNPPMIMLFWSTDTSFTLEIRICLGRMPSSEAAIKMLPMAEWPFVSSVLVEIDVEGFRVLKFIETCASNLRWIDC
ncbi:MAG: hypothetical protein ACTS7I_01345 [Candidatus Hodgkinia cicadicola]